MGRGHVASFAVLGALLALYLTSKAQGWDPTTIIGSVVVVTVGAIVLNFWVEG